MVLMGVVYKKICLGNLNQGWYQVLILRLAHDNPRRHLNEEKKLKE